MAIPVGSLGWLELQRSIHMRCARKVGLMVAMVVAALAMAASSASAQGVEVEEFPGGGHCGAVTTPSPHEATGMCEVTAHATGVVLTVHFSPTVEMVGSVCNNEFEGYVASNGSGYITHQVLSGANCTTPVCPEVAGGPANEFGLWPIQLREDAANSEELMVTFCVVTSLGRVTCEIDVDVEGSPGAYSFEAIDERCHNIIGYPNFEVSGHWTVENQSIEIHHL